MVNKWKIAIKYLINHKIKTYNLIDYSWISYYLFYIILKNSYYSGKKRCYPPKIHIKNNIKGAYSKIGEHLITKNIPAVTIVAACIMN